ncbi:MAG TPA: TniQ family protein [Streptosporangiaceae bacterium]|jgi:hypothetical protein
MTVPAAERTLPIRVPIAAGESLDSWLEALARRNGLTIRRLLPVLGWRPPATAAGLVLAIPPPVLRRIERQAGLSPGRLDDAVPDPRLPSGLIRRDGSRYCPRCLAGQDGRWPLAWRLPWAFACPLHRILLEDSCPGCGQQARGHLSAAGLNPPGTCPASLAPGKCCGTDLRTITSPQPSATLLQAQQQISTLLTPGTGHAPTAQSFSDLKIVAGWLLRHAPERHFAGFGSPMHDAWRAWQAQPPAVRSQQSRIPPASAALTGALSALAMPLITSADEEAISQLRALLPPARDPHKTRPPGLTAAQWAQLSAQMQGRFLRALDPGLTPLERIRYRSGTILARIPGDDGDLLAARARGIPQVLWPEWAIRLMPPESVLPIPFRATIAACLLLPGNPARAIQPAASGPHAYRSRVAMHAILRTLASNGHDVVFAAISCLAGYLDTHGSAIDYQRRRVTIPANTITKEQWQDLCDQASAHPGQDRRLLEARRCLYQLLTGADLNDPHGPLAFRTRADRAAQLAFTDTLTTPLRAALHAHATGFLRGLGLNEPLTWQPPASCCAHLTLPGRDPDNIDLDAVRQLVITSQLPPGTAAAQLGTTISHIRLALENIDRPAPSWGRNAPPVVHQWQQRARRILTRSYFEREYLQARKTLRQLEAETGFPRKYIADCARQHGITLTSAFDPLPIDPQWLREQYITHQRSYTDIAAELGVTDVTVIAAARRHGITSRPPGVHSHPEMITTLSLDIPADIRHAVEGTLHGWHRLHRFQAAMNFPTIQAAASHLGTHQSALTHQFHRLERDIGGPLYHRSAPGQPMRPTDRGTALLKALNQPSARAIASQQTRTAGEPHPYPVARQPAQAAKRTAMNQDNSKPPIQDNSELPGRLADLLDTHTAGWVETQQPIQWHPATWQRHWRTHRLPGGHVLDELEAEYEEHGTIRRAFIFDTYTDRPATELFTAAMAWGRGPDNRGPAKASAILTQPDAARKIEATVSTVRTNGAAAGYKAYYSHYRLDQLNIAFVTKLLYFAGYRIQQERRPLIYDNLVSAAITRLPTAPLLPLTAEPRIKVRTSKYERYCEWAENLATERQTEPAAVEWALFYLGGQIRDALRA